MPSEIPIRIHFHQNSGLNIVPSDYAAKILYQATFKNWKGESFYLANPNDTPHTLYVSIILEALGIKGCSFVKDEPVNKNEFEKFYYKTVGKLFTPYAETDPIIFDTSNIDENLKSFKLICPEVNRDNFIKLIDFAKKKYFNLSLEK